MAGLAIVGGRVCVSYSRKSRVIAGIGLSVTGIALGAGWEVVRRFGRYPGPATMTGTAYIRDGNRICLMVETSAEESRVMVGVGLCMAGVAGI